MRVAVVTSQFPGRVSTFFARDLRALIEAGVDVEVFPIYPLDASLWRYVPDCLGEDVLPRTRVHHLSLGAASGALARLAPEPRRRLTRDAARVLRSAGGFGVAPLLKTAYVVPKAAAWARQIAGRFDHVFAYWGNYAGTCAWLMTRLLPEPVPFSLFLHAGTDLFRDQVFLREKVLAASTIVTECEFNRRFLRDLYPDIWPRIEGKVQVNHMGVDLAELAVSSAPRAAARVIGVGRLDPLKGYDYLVRAVARLAAGGSPVELELVGDGPQRRELGELAEALGIGDRVHFRGWLPFAGVRQAMAGATLLVHPSSGIGDAKPNVIEEALALGTPVIASRVAGIPELLDDGACGVLVPPRDVAALEAAIEGLLADEPRRCRYAIAGRRHAEQALDLWRNGRRLAEQLHGATPALSGAAVASRSFREPASV